MKTLCYILADTRKTQAAILEITARVPCFVSSRRFSTDSTEYTFVTREEDAAFIERELAPII